MKTHYLTDLNRQKLLGRQPAWGNKALGLWFLQRHGFPVPRTIICTWKAYQCWAQGDPRVIAEVRADLAHMLAPERAYAVRSSANVEDSGAHSFAGQFTTILDVRGADEIVQAIEQIWTQARSSSTEAYREQVGVRSDAVKMAVLVQEMVHPVVSGVSFSVNPLTGMSEVVVEAVRGSGAALLQGGIKPHRWVNKWGTWTEKGKGMLPNQGETELRLFEQVVRQTRSIAQLFGRPVDLEWVWDGETLHWVQLREITALDVDLYSNRISKEMFPGLIKPLVWSVNVPLVNGVWVKIFTELIGPNDLDPNDLAKSFYGRAYFNMSAVGRIFEMLGFPRESLELMMGLEADGPEKPSFKPSFKTYTLLPRMLFWSSRLLGINRRIQAFLPLAWARYKELAAQPLDVLDEHQLVQHVERLYTMTQKVTYYNILAPLLMQAYNRMLKSQLARVGLTLESLDLTKGAAELQQYDPSSHLVALHFQYVALEAEVQARIEKEGYPALGRIPGAESFHSALEQFLEQFGHLSDSGNDFSVVPWREAPELVLQMVIQYPEPAEEGDQMGFEDLLPPAARKPLLRHLYGRARQFCLHREAVSSLYTYGYGLFRDVFLALGERFSERGLLDSRDDIFYLDVDQVRTLVSEPQATGVQVQVEQKREELERCRDLVPPNLIYGDEVPPVQTGELDSLQGTPTSRGRYSGPVRVVQGIQDFHKVQQGDVLVIPYADVGWTPLFARAGAVVAESGGMLSHSSIVAREYQIPAIVSVTHACQLADDTIVSVDGYLGKITVHQPA